MLRTENPCVGGSIPPLGTTTMPKYMKIKKTELFSPVSTGRMSMENFPTIVYTF